MRKLSTALAVLVCLALAAASGAFAGEPKGGGHVLPNPLAEKQNALRKNALQLKIQGKIAPDAKVAKLGTSADGKGQYVKLAEEGQGKIFVILAEFGNQIHPVTGGTPGPLHGQMTPPDRNYDNTLIWFDGGYPPSHYSDLYFNSNPGANSVTNYYKAQSGGRFSFTGGVTNWTKVAYNEARYGTNICGSTVCTTVWSLLRDASDQWVTDQLAAGRTMDQIEAELASYDLEDRYDADEDGNFDEADHYIDHFQLLHAGADEAVGGGAQGTDAIWSHRWYAWQSGLAAEGPGPAGAHLGGFQIGAKSGHPTAYWVGDYLMIPENAGVGVIAHETGHDYGLPDEYDTTYGGETSAGFWTIMASGSYGGDNTNGIGNKPVDFDAWDKFQLGWLDYRTADPLASGKSEVKLGPMEFATKQPQAVFVTLPSKTKTSVVGTPTSGTKAWYSTMGDTLRASLYRTLTLPAGTSSLSMKAWWEIEQDYDYAFVQVSTDGGSTYVNVPTNVSDPAAGDGGITGTSSTTKTPADAWNDGDEPAWVNVTADLSPWAGQTITLRFRYVTDSGVAGRGFEFDDLAITNGASIVFADGAENGDNGWTKYNFRITEGSDTRSFPQAYVIENRQYVSYDAGLRTGPYSFGFLNDPLRQQWVEHFPYQDGVLISLWDSSWSRNDISQQDGEGEILPIDVTTNTIMRPTFNPDCTSNGGTTGARARYQAYDATLSIAPYEALSLHQCGAPYGMPAHPGVTVFDDRGDFTHGAYSNASGGVKVPHAGVIVKLKDMDEKGFANVSIEPAK